MIEVIYVRPGTMSTLHLIKTRVLPYMTAERKRLKAYRSRTEAEALSS